MVIFQIKPKAKLSKWVITINKLSPSNKAVQIGQLSALRQTEPKQFFAQYLLLLKTVIFAENTIHKRRSKSGNIQNKSILKMYALLIKKYNRRQEIYHNYNVTTIKQLNNCEKAEATHRQEKRFFNDFSRLSVIRDILCPVTRVSRVILPVAVDRI